MRLVETTTFVKPSLHMPLKGDGRIRDITVDVADQHDRLSDYFSRRGLELDDLDRIHEYTFLESGPLNRLLINHKGDFPEESDAGTETPKLRKIHNTLSHAVDISKPTPEDIHSYSIISPDFHEKLSKVSVGTTFHSPAWISSSLHPNSFGSNHHYIHFHIPSGTSGIGTYIGHLSKYPDEREFLIRSGSLWQKQDEFPVEGSMGQKTVHSFKPATE